MKSAIANIFLILIVTVIYSTAYKVAVVEYHRGTSGDFDENINHNLNEFMQILNNTVIKNKDLDMIVFPEASLVHSSLNYTKEEALSYASNIPDGNTTIPCLEPEETTIFYVKELSCAARRHQVYLVSNIFSKNAENELFDTNVVFDRQGRLITVYRKMKPLSNEKYLSPGKTPATFQTDFGATFGTMICQDIMFPETYQESLEKNVDAFVFTTSWTNRLPQSVSIQIQNMWSYYFNTVLIASNNNIGTNFRSGSGIYAGRNNPYTTNLSSENKTTVLVADITKDPPKYDHSKHIRKLDNIRLGYVELNYTYHSLRNEEANTNIHKTICESDFCCEFKLNVNDTTGLMFTMLNDQHSENGYISQNQLCQFMQCDEEESCTKLPEEHMFYKAYNTLEVKVVSKSDLYVPIVTLQDFYYLPVENYTFIDKELVLKLTQPSKGVYIFGLIGRVPLDDVSLSF